jgi:hypothetical protein
LLLQFHFAIYHYTYNISFVHLTEEEIGANVKASAVEEGSDNDLDEPQEFTRRRHYLAWEEMALVW